MGGFLDDFRKKVINSVWEEGSKEVQEKEIDDKIAFGVLLWVVAESDGKFLPKEKDKIKGILKEFSKISDEDLVYIMESVEVAAKERIDLYAFTSEVSEDLPREIKIKIIENLFRVACSDNDLASEEHDTIRKIANLFRLDHKEFIDTKVKIKKEFGMDTAGL